MLLPNTILQGRYLIFRALASGGMGTVYEAIDQSVSSKVALKETNTGDNDELRRAFEREAKLLANLRHSSLPKVMHHFVENGTQYLVMEFVPGDDLARLLAVRDRPFPLSQVLKWADDLLGVLEYLHSQKPPIIHRDIKPANLKCTPGGELHLLDFGLAKGTAGYMTPDGNTTSVYGFTPVYAPLEQIRGAGTDQRSDLYALAATLVHLWKGQQPPAAYEREEAIANGEPDPLEEVFKNSTDLPNEIGIILKQALALERRRRHASATEMRRALRKAMGEDDQNLVSRLQTMALTDQLTGCYSRRGFDMQLDRDLHLARRMGCSLSLILVDIDHLKRINEQHGYEVGDEVLRSVAGCCQRELRVVDTAARYDLVDFAIILPQADMEGALIIAERIRCGVEYLSSVAEITVSAGIATFPENAASSDTLLKKALAALNASKRSGGNRVSLAE